MSQEDDRWRPAEPPPTGPSAAPEARFDPLATAIGVFVAIGVPVFVVGYGFAGSASAPLIAAAIVSGLVAGLLAGLWVAHRDGRVWRGPQL